MSNSRERNLRCKLNKAGYYLVKLRDWKCYPADRYMIVDSYNCIVGGGEGWLSLTLDEVEAWLAE